MQRSEIKVLVIEDDATFGKALEESLKRAGYNVQLVANFSNAESAVKISEFHALVVDCMLPQKNGIDTALALKSEMGTDTLVFLMSGIYKDKSYAVDAQQKTKARAFYNKPFDIQLLIDELNKNFASAIDQDTPPLHQLLGRPNQSMQEKIQAINDTQYTHGYDLPLVYNTLMDAKVSGELSVTYDDGRQSKVIFRKGAIEEVIHVDTESYFGVLLIEKGFITPDELALNLNKNDGKRIGERLVDSSTLSPHAINVIKYEQMIIRLSKTIQDTSIKIFFVEGQSQEPTNAIDAHLLTALTSDWVCSKLTVDWLRTFYNPWLSNKLINGPNFARRNQVKDLVACKSLLAAFPESGFNLTVAECLDSKLTNEEAALRGLHFLMLQKIVALSQKEGVQANFEMKVSRFEKILQSFEGKSHFIVLGVSKNARSQEIHRVYTELAKSLHPDKISPDSPDELKELAKKVFSRITEAYQVLSHEEKKANYLKTLEIGHAEEILKAESTFDEGLRQLKQNQYKDARKTFERTMKFKGHRSDAIIYYMWAYIKEKRKKLDAETLSSEIKNLLSQVAHEDRHSPQYFFVRGMHYELNSQLEKAYNSFKHCTKIDPSFIDAKREATFLKQKYGSNKKTSILTEDLSTVVTKLFKKKAG